MTKDRMRKICAHIYIHCVTMGGSGSKMSQQRKQNCDCSEIILCKGRDDIQTLCNRVLDFDTSQLSDSDKAMIDRLKKQLCQFGVDCGSSYMESMDLNDRDNYSGQQSGKQGETINAKAEALVDLVESLPDNLQKALGIGEGQKAGARRTLSKKRRARRTKRKPKTAGTRAIRKLKKTKRGR